MMRQAKKNKSVSVARRVALDVLRRVEAENAFASLALDHALMRRGVRKSEDRRLAAELVYGTLRWRRRLDYALAAHSRRSLDRIEPTLLRILRMTAYQLLFLDRVPAWAAVDEGTSLAVAIRGSRAGGFVNAVARGLAGAVDRIDWPDPEGRDRPVRALGILHSFPDWMVESWLDLFGMQRAVSLMESLNLPAPLWVRANTLRVKPDGLVNLLSASGVDAVPVKSVPDALTLKGSISLRELAAHEAGLMHVQDAAAQAVCLLLAPKPGQRVLDACAAPGGKTATIAQLMENKGEVLAMDAHPARLGLVRKLADRLGIKIVQTELADASETRKDVLGQFDRVLLDAPCTALGVIRRHPESKWRLLSSDIDRMVELQETLLDAMGPLVTPGGFLVYSICSFSPAEGPELIERWLARHPEFIRHDPRTEKRSGWHSLLDAQSQMLTWPDENGMDGFFAVRLQRQGD